jgi:superfamily II DNA or RNA helicase
MQLTVGAKIRVENPSREAVKWCRENLTLPNPEYYKKEKMGKWTGGTPENIILYERNGSDWLLPFGCINRFWREVAFNGSYKLEFCDLRHFNYQSRINLYEYQKNAVEAALRAKNGIIVMPCGAGKTQTALELVARIGGKALWLTHTQDLLNQSMNRAKSVYDCGEYGTITGGKVNIGEGITFATIQTMAKLDLPQYKDCWDVVIVDECHKAVGSPTKVMQFYKVLSNLSCRYKFGLTATPKRADGLEKSMFALLGDVVYTVTKEDVKDTTCPIRVQMERTYYFPNCDIVLAGDGTINYAKLVDDLTHDEKRFNRVANWLEFECEEGATLVLANRVEYLERLNKTFVGKSVCLSALGNSKAAKAERKEALRKLNDGEIECVFATYQLAKEGLDVPNLRTLVLATPEKDETTVIQAVGRVGRKAEGKEFGTVIDFVDNFGLYKSWQKKRLSVYKKIGCDIIE